MAPFWLALPGFIIWVCILFLPWRPWSTRESLEATAGSGDDDLSRVTVLIPARNEEKTIARTLLSLAGQGHNHRIILIDDQSTDNTVAEARKLELKNLMILEGQPLPEGWTGKLWALQQGLEHAQTGQLLLLDADIELVPGTLAALLDKLEKDNLQMVSLMAFLRMESFWEKLLMPAFIYFFKLLYPFRLSNSDSKLIAAAAGGCILIRKEMLNTIGGFAVLRNALIDDCTLARCVKNHGGKTWLGLTHSARSHRQYNDLKTIWDMVARTAYTQLHYSVGLLVVCSLLLLTAYLLPLITLFVAGKTGILLAVTSLAIMAGTYLPTLTYYNINIFWAFSLPAIATLYLLMTWASAIRYWRGTSAIWKERSYDNQGI